MLYGMTYKGKQAKMYIEMGRPHGATKTLTQESGLLGPQLWFFCTASRLLTYVTADYL